MFTTRFGNAARSLYDSHEACKDDCIDPRLLEDLYATLFRRSLKLRLPRRAVEVARIYAALPRPFEDKRVGDVGKDDSYLRVERPRIYRLHYRLHVGSRSGSENSQMQLSHFSSRLGTAPDAQLLC